MKEESLKNIDWTGAFFLSLTTIFLIIIPCFKLTSFNHYDESRLLQVFFLISIITILYVDLYVFDVYETLNSMLFAHVIIVLFLSIGLLGNYLNSNNYYGYLGVIHYAILYISITLLVQFFFKRSTVYYDAINLMVLLFAGLYLLRFIFDYYQFLSTDIMPLWPQRSSLKLLIDGVEYSWESFLGFVHVRYLNHLQTWTLPLLGLIYFNKSFCRSYLKYIPFTILTLWWMLVIGSGARGTFVATILGLSISWVLFRGKANKFLKVQGWALIISIALYGIFFRWIPAIFKSGNVVVKSGGPGVSLVREGATGRLDMWENAWELFMEYPLLGSGPMQYANVKFGHSLAAPHNMYLQILSEWGFISFALLGILVLWALYKWIIQSLNAIDSNTELETITRVALTTTIISIAIHCSVSNVLNTPLSQVYFCLVVAWTISLYLKCKYRRRTLRQRKISSINTFTTGLLIYTLLSVYVGLLSKDLGSLDMRKNKYPNKYESNKIHPRYWGQGKIGIENK